MLFECEIKHEMEIVRMDDLVKVSYALYVLYAMPNLIQWFNKMEFKAKFCDVFVFIWTTRC